MPSRTHTTDNFDPSACLSQRICLGAHSDAAALLAELVKDRNKNSAFQLDAEGFCRARGLRLARSEIELILMLLARLSSQDTRSPNLQPDHAFCADNQDPKKGMAFTKAKKQDRENDALASNKKLEQIAKIRNDKVAFDRQGIQCHQLFPVNLRRYYFAGQPLISPLLIAEIKRCLKRRSSY